MCDDYDDGDGTVLVRRFITARKEHRCFARDERIAVGARYHRDTAAHDGTVSSFVHCTRCWAIVEALWSQGMRYVDFDLNCGDTWEDPPDHVAALAFALPGEVSP